MFQNNKLNNLNILVAYSYCRCEKLRIYLPKKLELLVFCGFLHHPAGILLQSFILYNLYQ